MSKSIGCVKGTLHLPLVLLAVAIAFGLTGCAVNPLVSWQRPEAKASPVPLVDAQRYADEARKAYRDARDKHVQAVTGLNSGLLSLGVLGTGLAVAKSHKDALLGTAFLGATAYAFGQQNLNVQHRLVYEAGIDAIGCAKDAIQPLAMSISDRQGLEIAMPVLDAALAKASSARAVATVALATWRRTDPEDSELEKSAKAAITASGQAIDAGTASVTSGRQLIRRSDGAGDALISAVERIDGAVNKAVTATLPDPSSVFKVISGLPGFAAGIVPGSDAAFTAALAKSSASFKPEAAPQSGNLNTKGVVNANEGYALYNAVAGLIAATDAVKLALAQVNGRLPTEETLRGLQSAKECGLGDVSFALSVVPSAPTITAGANRKTPFVVSGGTPPYTVQLQVTPVKGVNLITPAPFDRTVVFDITTEAVAGTVPVVVMDASRPTKSMVVSVEILAAEGGAKDEETPSPESGKLRAPKTATDLAQRINAAAVFKHKDGVELSVANPATRKSDTQVDLGLRCKPLPKNGKCLPAAEVAQTVADTVAASGMAKLLRIAPTASCVCAP
ncbi:hypothetical protein LNV23_04010 [Paucibacter sp. DJ1R-11]|uniref:hypothetical protein n=1 Tax=Paucibacter sp. DJ1R-11 TaxID=2893556 RepID=UPI0021E49AFB|nr:hypothetical protein [Paucibacter sp. DJ1R-11]MCV2362613.1 hypothetical protein [Paucibacter sp. DJ1R-11]